MDSRATLRSGSEIMLSNEREISASNCFIISCAKLVLGCFVSISKSDEIPEKRKSPKMQLDSRNSFVVTLNSTT